MLEQLIERLKLEGKITQEEIDEQVAQLKSQQPPTQEELQSLKKRQDETENTIVFILDMTLGGM